MKKVLIVLAVVIISAGNLLAATLPCERILKKDECVQTKCVTTGKVCNWIETAGAAGKCSCVQPPLPCEKIVKKEECVQTKCATTGKVCNWIETAAAPGGKCSCIQPQPKPCKEIKLEKECISTTCKETSRPCNWITNAAGAKYCSCLPK